MGGLLFVYVPLTAITKIPTKNALALIEDRWLQQDLTDADKAQFQQAKNAVLGNQRAAGRSMAVARRLGLGVCLVLLIQSVAGLRHENRQTQAKDTTPNDEPATLVDK